MSQINHLHAHITSTGMWGVGGEGVREIREEYRVKRDVVKGMKERNVKGQTVEGLVFLLTQH